MNSLQPMIRSCTFLFCLLISTSMIQAQESARTLEVKFGIEDEFRAFALNQKYILKSAKKDLKIFSSELSQSIKQKSFNFNPYQYELFNLLEAKTTSSARALPKTIREAFKKSKEAPPNVVVKDLSPDTIPFSNQIEFQLSNGDEFTIELTEDMGSLELAATPFTKKELLNERDQILKFVRAVLKKSGFKPARFFSEGHLHLDFNSIFFDGQTQGYDIKLFRNFFVDFVNHNELYFGALHFSPTEIQVYKSSPVLTDLDLRRDFEDWVERMDWFIREPKRLPENPEVFLSTQIDTLKKLGFVKGFALNVDTRTPRIRILPRTLEWRALANRKSVEDLKLQIELIEARLNYLKNRSELVPLYPAGAIQSAQEGVNRFYRYTQEAGLDYSRFKKLLPISWRLKKPETLPDELLFRKGPLLPTPGFRCRVLMERLL